MTPSDRRLRLAGVAGVTGPTVFIACWIAAGVLERRDLSLPADAISRLAAADADTRWMMATGFITFGVGVGTFAVALRSVLPGRAWLAVGATALATMFVATAPLGVSAELDQLHGIFAAAGYVTLVAAPLLAATPLRRRGFARLAVAGRVAAVIAAVSLTLSIVGPATGLFQRIGLTAVDLWLISLAALVASGRLTRVHDQHQDRVWGSHADTGPAATHPPDAGATPDADTRTDPWAGPPTPDSPTRSDPTDSAAAAHSAA